MGINRISFIITIASGGATTQQQGYEWPYSSFDLVDKDTRPVCGGSFFVLHVPTWMCVVSTYSVRALDDVLHDSLSSRQEAKPKNCLKYSSINLNLIVSSALNIIADHELQQYHRLVYGSA